MSNAPTRGTEIQLDKVRFLRYPLSVLKELQKEGSDKSLGQILFLGLTKDDPSLTLEQVEDMIDLENLPDLYDPVKKATGGLIDLRKIFEKMGGGPGPQIPSPATGQGSSAS